ncbi:MAG: hypothetical protein LBS24_06495 [Clostridiales Family XIII bacterium]|nr:hypothetical protein [Clostridiales Family XIII bacterium]
MSNEPRAMKEIHDIRLKIHEETKDMTMEQRMEHTRKSVEEFEAKHGKLRRPDDVPAAYI